MINRARDADALIVLVAPFGLLGIALLFLFFLGILLNIGNGVSDHMIFAVALTGGMPALSLIWVLSMLVLGLLPTSGTR